MQDKGLQLVPATDADVDALMDWFPDVTSLRRWGGPGFRYPVTPAGFREDLGHRGQHNFALRDGAGALLGFGQFYPRWQRIHLSRIATHPAHRGTGLGKVLVRELLLAGRQQLALAEFALFVYRDNDAALAVYRATGFTVADSPDQGDLYGNCWYMTRPASGLQERVVVT